VSENAYLLGSEIEIARHILRGATFGPPRQL
jgi:hypothetical protein